MKFMLLLFVALATARAQEDFRAFSGTDDLPDGGQVATLTVASGDLHFKFQPPKGWSCHVDGSSRQLILDSPTVRSEIKVLFPTKSAGPLPDETVLRARVLQSLPGASLLQTSVCPTGYAPGVFFDLILNPSPGVVLTVRHAYAATPNGQLEFILAANGEEFEKSKFVFMTLLQSLQVAQPDEAGALVSGELRKTNALTAAQLYQNKINLGRDYFHENPLHHSVFIMAMPPQTQARPTTTAGQTAARLTRQQDSSPDWLLPSLAAATLVITFAGVRYHRHRQISQVVFHEEFETLWEPPPEVAPRKMAEETFFCKAEGVYGRGRHSKEGFLVLKSSIGRKESAGEQAESLQAKLLGLGVTHEQEDMVIFDKDHLFPTPTLAASALMGRKVNGWLEWKTEDGITLDTVERLELKQQSLEIAPSAELAASAEPSESTDPS